MNRVQRPMGYHQRWQLKSNSGHLMWRDDWLEKTLTLGKTEGRRSRDDRGWDGWVASPTRWTWVWASSESWWWTGKPGVLQSTGSQSRTRLSDWTELNQHVHNRSPRKREERKGHKKVPNLYKHWRHSMNPNRIKSKRYTHHGTAARQRGNPERRT